MSILCTSRPDIFWRVCQVCCHWYVPATFSYFPLGFISVVGPLEYFTIWKRDQFSLKVLIITMDKKILFWQFSQFCTDLILSKILFLSYGKNNNSLMVSRKLCGRVSGHAAAGQIAQILDMYRAGHMFSADNNCQIPRNRCMLADKSLGEIFI